MHYFVYFVQVSPLCHKQTLFLSYLNIQPLLNVQENEALLTSLGLKFLNYWVQCPWMAPNLEHSLLHNLPFSLTTYVLHSLFLSKEKEIADQGPISVK